MDGHEHVHVAIGDDALAWDGGQFGEVARTLQALFFAGDEDEEDAAFERPGGLEKPGDFDGRGDAGGVIHGAVKDAIAGEGLHFAGVIDVGADDDILLALAGQEADDVLRIELAFFDRGGGGEFLVEREVRQGRLTFAELE